MKMRMGRLKQMCPKRLRESSLLSHLIFSELLTHNIAGRRQDINLFSRLTYTAVGGLGFRKGSIES